MSGEGTYVCKLDKETLKKAKKELNEDETQRASQIEALRRWVKGQPHLNSRTDDEFLLRFLRVAKFSQLKAQERLENFWTMRSSSIHGMPDWFKGMNPLDPSMSEVIDLGVTVPLPGRDDNNRKVILIRPGHYDPNKYTLYDIFKASNMGQDILQLDEMNIIHGYVLLQDFGEFSASHIYHWDRTTVQRASKCWQDVYPSRNKQVNFYNTPTIFNAFYEVVKFFLKEKTLSRVVFHKSNLESVHKTIPKRILPSEYGGEAGPIAGIIKEWKETMVKGKAEFELNDRHGVDDSKRVVTSSADSGGIVGTFRKLVV